MHGSQQGASFGVPRGQPPAEAVRSGSPTVRSRRTGEREAVPITPARGLEKRSKEKLKADVVDDEASSFGDGWFGNALSWVGIDPSAITGSTQASPTPSIEGHDAHRKNVEMLLVAQLTES